MKKLRFYEANPENTDSPDRAVELEISDNAAMCTLRFGQTIDEMVEFTDILAALAKSPCAAGKTQHIRADFRRTTRISSHGARNWLFFMREIQATGVLEFEYLSEPLLSIAAMWPEILGTPRAPIESFEVWFACETCRTREPRSFPVTALSKSHDKVLLPATYCGKCQGPLSPDVDESEYFRPLLTA